MRIIEKAQHKPEGDVLASFLTSSSIEQVKESILPKEYPRQRLVEILEKYNRSIGNDAAALKNIEILGRSDSVCVFTGQQLGLMGGPLYMILKGISCLLTARKAGAIPIFWLATDDHDIAEINHTYLLDALGNLQRFQLSFPKDARSVEDLVLGPKNVEVIQEFLRVTNIKDFEISASYCETMARMMAKLFAGTGMVFLEPKLLRPLAVSFFRREIENNAAIQQVLKETTGRLKAAGGDIAISIGEGTNLFMKDQNGFRRKIKFDKENFMVGTERLTVQQVLSLIDQTPERFSTNVASRPVLQSVLFPTVAYVAGPSEIAYFRQLGDYFRFHDVMMPCVIRRLSASIIPSFAETLLQQSALDPWADIPLHDSKIPGFGLHYLRNLLHPHEKPQERVLNWWGFQGTSAENLILECLKTPTLKSDCDYLFYL